MFDRWKKRREAVAAEANALRERIEQRHALPGVPSQLTALEALEIAKPLALEIDPAATLGIVVGHDVQRDGRTRRWECLFDGRGVLANVNVELEVGFEEAGLEGDDHAVVVALPKMAWSEDSFMPQLWAGLSEKERDVFRKERFKEPPLELSADSPAVMAAFLSEGLDIDAGPTDVVLATKREAGEAWWELAVGRDTYRRRLSP